MYNNSKYTKWYFGIIKKAQSQNRKRLRKDNPSYVYYERHHIIPDSLGGSDDKSNLVLLTSREHFVCHVLLPKMCVNFSDKYKMNWALTAMSMKQSRLGTYFNSRLFEYYKNRIEVARSENTKALWNSEEFRHTHRESMKSVYEDPNVRMKISSSLVDHYSDENNRNRQSTKTKEKFEDETYRNNHLEGVRKSYESGERSLISRDITKSLWETESYRDKHKDRIDKLKRKCTNGTIVFDSMRDMSKELNIPTTTLSRRLNSDKKKWEDYKWIK